MKDNARIARELIRMAKELIAYNDDQAKVEPGLRSLMTKKSVERYLRKLVDTMPGMHGYDINDGTWGAVYDVFDKIKSVGADLETFSRNGGYWYCDCTVNDLPKSEQGQCLSDGEHLIGGKKWQIKIEINGMQTWRFAGEIWTVFEKPGFVNSPYRIYFSIA